MKKLVRRLLVHYDRYGVMAAILWFMACVAVTAAAFIPAEQFFLEFTAIPSHASVFPTMFLVSPLVIYICPTVWAAIVLANEQLWMFLGIHKAKGWEPHHFRKLIGRLVDEQS